MPGIGSNLYQKTSLERISRDLRVSHYSLVDGIQPWILKMKYTISSILLDFFVAVSQDSQSKKSTMISTPPEVPPARPPCVAPCTLPGEVETPVIISPDAP